MTATDVPFCCRCHEEFPVASKVEQLVEPVRMGLLYKLTRFGKRVKDKLDREPTSDFLCGNCYFDLTDED